MSKEIEVEELETSSETKKEKVIYKELPLKKKLYLIQSKIKVPKGQQGYGYKYRNTTDILQKLKLLMKQLGVFITLSDDVVEAGGHCFIKATASIHDINTNESIMATGMARDGIEKKGMDAAQLTGASSTYARKYALGGLLLIDDSKDPDDK